MSDNVNSDEIQEEKKPFLSTTPSVDVDAEANAAKENAQNSTTDDAPDDARPLRLTSPTALRSCRLIFSPNSTR